MSRPKQGKERPGGCAIERAHRNKIEESDGNIGRSADSQCGVQRAEVAVPPVDQTDERGCGEQQLADYTAPRDLCGFHFCLGMIETTETVNWVDLNREHAIAETSGDKLMPEFVHNENEAGFFLLSSADRIFHALAGIGAYLRKPARGSR